MAHSGLLLRSSLQVEPHQQISSLGQAVSADGELRVGAAEGLGASSCTGEDLGLGHTLLAGQVAQELNKISLEACLLGGCDKAEDIHVAILAVVQLPAGSCQGDGCNGAASSRDGASAAERGEPDHDFVLGVASGGGGGEQIERYVGDDVRAAVGPCVCRGKRLDGGQCLLANCSHNVGVGLDMSSTIRKSDEIIYEEVGDFVPASPRP